MRLSHRHLGLFIISTQVAGLYSVGAEAASIRTCEAYAQVAIDHFKIAQRPQLRKCYVAPSPRWQASYQNHYGWCLQAPDQWVDSEERARRDHLLRCGGLKNW